MSRPADLVPRPATASTSLGAIRYTNRSGEPSVASGGVTMDVHLAAAGEPDAVDVWPTSRPVTAVDAGRVKYAHDGEVALFAARLPRADRCAAAVEHLYAELFALTASTGYREVFRVWQYIEDVNGLNADGVEVYQDFCVGRATAFERHGGTAAMPAATGVGAHSGGISVHLLAGREPVRHLENPRQVPAYHYPRRYGPKPPSFARATWRDGELHLSGTAAIVGHRTVCPGDAAGQCREALRNIEALLAPEGASLSGLDRVKVYVRRAEDLEEVRGQCLRAFPAGAAFFVVDLCRQDLLVEIEGTWRAAR
jgi:chorismate lyase/3-hydroxybenzoate synthase